MIPGGLGEILEMQSVVFNDIDSTLYFAKVELHANTCVIYIYE